MTARRCWWRRRRRSPRPGDDGCAGNWNKELGTRKSAGPQFFRTPRAFRSWLAKKGAKSDELLVGFWKLGSGKGGLTYAQALDEALCHGWIDGVRRNLDNDSYSIRFTPRRKGSIWSNVNIGHVERLQKAGLMRAEGLAAYAKRSDKRTGIYGHEGNRIPLDASREKTFRKNKKAWAFWEGQTPGYKRLWSWWVMNARQDTTRERRLAAIIDASAHGEKLDAMASPYQRQKKATA